MPDFHWMMQVPDTVVRPFRVQSVFWREAVSAMAGVAELQADCLRKLAGANTMMDAVAIQGEYMQKLMQSAENEGNRIALVVKSAALPGQE